MLADTAATAAATMVVAGAAQHDAELDGEAVAHERGQVAGCARRRLAHGDDVRQQAGQADGNTIDLPQSMAVVGRSAAAMPSDVSGVE